MRFDGEKQPDAFHRWLAEIECYQKRRSLRAARQRQEQPARRGFKGLRWFPARESYRVTASFVPDAQTRKRSSS